MPTITVIRRGRTWYGRPTYSVIVEDPTGRIGWHGFSRRDAVGMARTFGPIMSGRPVGEIALMLAQIMAADTSIPDSEWTVKF